jgi:peptide/nickel transport system substrate-binding protein
MATSEGIDTDMNNEWDRLSWQLKNGIIGRREFLAAAAALGISAAPLNQALAQTPKRGGHLIMGQSEAGSGDSLDPGRFKAVFMSSVGGQLYDSLTLVDEQFKVRPAIAKSWDAKPGATEWVFKLRRDVTFHNGKPVTAADVIYSINHHRGKNSQSAAKGLLTAVTDIKASDKDEITITFESGNADAPYILADWHIAIVPEDSAYNDGIGTGAFMLESFEPGVRARTTRSPNDYRSDRGYVDTVETLAINDPVARISALLSGSVHIINQINPHNVAALQKHPETQIFNIAGTGHCEFGMFIDRPPFNDPDLRLALKYAIDREAILKTVLHGYGKLGNDQPIASFDPFYASDIPQRHYDPEKAKFYYKKSGQSAPVVLTVAEAAFSGAVDMAQIINSGATKAGINVQINRVPNDGYYDTVWLKNPFCACDRGGRPTADLMFSSAYLSTSPTNDTHWNNPRFDQLLFAARAELDTAKRKQIYRDMQLMLHDEGGALIPVFKDSIDGGLKKVRGFALDPNHPMSGWRAAEKVWFAS